MVGTGQLGKPGINSVNVLLHPLNWQLSTNPQPKGSVTTMVSVHSKTVFFGPLGLLAICSTTQSHELPRHTRLQSRGMLNSQASVRP